MGHASDRRSSLFISRHMYPTDSQTASHLDPVRAPLRRRRLAIPMLPAGLADLEGAPQEWPAYRYGLGQRRSLRPPLLATVLRPVIGPSLLVCVALAGITSMCLGGCGAPRLSVALLFPARTR
jgi:hypothetical protein